MNKYRGPQRRVIFPRPLAGVEMALKIRRRARLRRKEASEFLRRLADEFGMAVSAGEGLLDEAEGRPHRLLLRGDEAVWAVLNGELLPAIPRLLPVPGAERALARDMGAG